MVRISQRLARRTRYTTKLGLKVTGLISQGLSIEAAARKLRISPSTVLRWRAKHLEFLEMYDDALELGAHALADEILKIVDDADLDVREIKVQYKMRQRRIERNFRHIEANIELRSSILARMSLDEKIRELHRLFPDRASDRR